MSTVVWRNFAGLAVETLFDSLKQVLLQARLNFDMQLIIRVPVLKTNWIICSFRIDRWTAGKGALEVHFCLGLGEQDWEAVSLATTHTRDLAARVHVHLWLGSPHMFFASVWAVLPCPVHVLTFQGYSRCFYQAPALEQVIVCFIDSPYWRIIIVF